VSEVEYAVRGCPFRADVILSEAKDLLWLNASFFLAFGSSE
jgi:coenzyme F420-reducing hydrogenase gamma subunit